ncbi:helix-turn-helix domain-containing protein [Pseudoduganella sp. UC29_106]|uniref:helix-turn-helix domain-containing protein n=1 Tax=Pseudoduganella sp. UC29_106 TaxID=3374553 RepID=UPI0037581EA5
MPSSKFSASIFGRRLRQARQLSGLPQDRLGVLAGLEESSSSARISRYESGIHEPTSVFAQALAEVLHVPAAYFYCADDDLAELILLYSGSKSVDRHELIVQARSLSDIPPRSRKTRGP